MLLEQFFQIMCDLSQYNFLFLHLWLLVSWYVPAGFNIEKQIVSFENVSVGCFWR